MLGLIGVLVKIEFKFYFFHQEAVSCIIHLKILSFICKLGAHSIASMKIRRANKALYETVLWTKLRLMKGVMQEQLVLGLTM